LNGQYVTEDTITTIAAGVAIKLEAEITPSGTPSVQQWEIPGTKIKKKENGKTWDPTIEKSEAPEEIGSNEDFLQKLEVNFYWVDGGERLKVKYYATVDDDPVEAETFVNVRKPTGTVNTEVGKLAVDREWDKRRVLALHFGVLTGLGKPGVRFTRVTQFPEGLEHGTFSWYQVLTKFKWTRTSKPKPPTTLKEGVGCDGTSPYSNNPNMTSDSPGADLTPLDEGDYNVKVTGEEEATMYLMYKPVKPTGAADVIEIPLFAIEWKCAATAACFYFGEPNYRWTAPWSGPYRVTPIEPVVKTTTDYPVWTDHVTTK
jgi:hypothetical protein